MIPSGYDSRIVRDFLTAHGQRRPTDCKLVRLNGTHLTESNREMVCRWESREEPVDLTKVDRLLLKYDLHTYELEQWAEEHFGWPGFVSPLC